MANDTLIDFQGDGASNDTILSYVHIQTVGYGGSYNDYVVPAAANFPLAGKDSSGGTVNPSRYIVRLNFTPFSNGSLPIILKDVTSGGTSLTPVTGAPSLNQYRWWYSANNNTVSPDVIEFNSGQAGHTIAIDCYAKQSILHSDQVNNPNTLNGDLHFTSTTNSTSKDTGSLILEGGIGVEKNIISGGYIQSSNGYICDYINSSGTLSNIQIKKTIIEIGTWNMVSTPVLNLNLSTTFNPTYIYFVDVLIIGDNGYKSAHGRVYGGGIGSPYSTWIGIYNLVTTGTLLTAELSTQTGSTYGTGTNFDGSQNRGYLLFYHS